ncbi:DnaB-like helicase N-terminal domain-containing protein [Streptomyces sp. NPDC032472]|uniref:DnaB-like helicase N-terminal domain-containing protein n=1 Tax=Streptomyces sp. NPDC032472 TaxID=3155018 RepID=UPI0034052625
MSGELTPERREAIREAEHAVMGVLLHEGVKDLVPDLVDALSGADFYDPRNGELWELMCSMWAAGAEACDPVTVTAELTRRGDLERLGGRVFLHELYDSVPSPAMALAYAEIVAEESRWRALAAAGTRTVLAAGRREGSAVEAAERAVEEARQVRDRGVSALDTPPLDLLDLLAQADDTPDWVIPGVLARWDRLMVTGPEGGGKSLLLRQILMRAVAGLHPWKRARIAPVRGLLVDAENSAGQARPWLRTMAAAAAAEGAEIGRGQLTTEIRPGGLDLTQPADRAWLLRLVERVRPDVIAIGPLYKLHAPRSGEAAEDSARALMTALEAVRVASDGAALLIEAHSPHAAPGVKRRDMRPIGSSLWLRWPEYGFGLAPADGEGSQELRLMDWVPWRGPRSERDWPEQMCQGATWPWQAIQYAGNAPVLGITLTEEQVAAAGIQVPEQREFWDDRQLT